MLYSFYGRANKDLEKLPKNIKQRIVDKLDYLCENNLLLANSKPMMGDFGGLFRIRVGDYRVIFDLISTSEARILRVGHRRDIYN